MSDRYRTIVADPPWPMPWSGGGATRVNGRGVRYGNRRFGRPGLDYLTMTIEEIAALRVADVADTDARLFLWIPDRFLIAGDGARVAAAWGFQPGRLLIWRKTGYGLGAFPRPQHEAAIVCRRGSPVTNRRDVGSVQTWKADQEKGSLNSVRSSRVHSRKPDGFLDLVESASPGPYLELFARRQRLGWDTWGNEALEHVALDKEKGERLGSPWL